MSTLVFCLEEPSARAMLQGLRLDGRNASASFCALIDGVRRLSV